VLKNDVRFAQDFFAEFERIRIDESIDLAFERKLAPRRVLRCALRRADLFGGLRFELIRADFAFTRCSLVLHLSARVKARVANTRCGSALNARAVGPSFRKYRTGSASRPAPLPVPVPPLVPLVPENSTLLMVSCRPCCPTRCRILAMIDGY